MTTFFIHVAVAVIVDQQQRILVALRPEHIHQGGLWEFPGGKVESGETVQQALVRELSEEIGITAEGFRSLIKINHDYGDKAVLLDVWWVDRFSGEPVGREGQPIRWVSADELSTYTFPEANLAIVQLVQRSLAERTTPA